MHLYLVPMIFILIGLAMYTVLGGADFGAGLWELTAGRGSEAKKVRDHAHHAIGPVWEANHVWLIFVFVVTWTAYPVAFGSIASTLCVPLFIAAVGIIFRGAAYALRSGAASATETTRIDTAFALSSILTPFALGTVVGSIAARRVPVGNAAGNLVTSWANPVSILIGALAVATGAYLAAVYLSADAVRVGDEWLEREFRIRALVAGVIAGGLAIAGLVVLHADVRPLFHKLVHLPGLAVLLVSVACGVLTLGLVLARRYELARFGAALAVAAIIAAWAVAQEPIILPGLTLARAAAPHDTLVAVVVAVLAGAALLFPSLAWLFTLVLHGRFDPGPAGAELPAERGAGDFVTSSRTGLPARAAVACAIAGFGLLTLADATWAHAIGVTCLLGFVVLGFVALNPTDVGPATRDEIG
ncbi:MAG TPA: cytochrome d ubiquinol oxidase subunit II [Solirubrobacteraceae bacterium]|nr:cytochrome d ubiquinol oxidase subunit II [Solirubrobacteraceae bacterium]